MLFLTTSLINPCPIQTAPIIFHRLSVLRHWRLSPSGNNLQKGMQGLFLFVKKNTQDTLQLDFAMEVTPQLLSPTQRVIALTEAQAAIFGGSNVDIVDNRNQYIGNFAVAPNNTITFTITSGEVLGDKVRIGYVFTKSATGLPVSANADASFQHTRCKQIWLEYYQSYLFDIIVKAQPVNTCDSEGVFNNALRTLSSASFGYVGIESLKCNQFIHDGSANAVPATGAYRQVFYNDRNKTSLSHVYTVAQLSRRIYNLWVSMYGD